jgi:autotransporter-associated beta strand protein
MEFTRLGVWCWGSGRGIIARLNLKNFGRAFAALCLGAGLLLPCEGGAQSLVITNGVATYASLTNYTVVLSNRCELRITAAIAPISGCLIHLNSPDAFFVLQNVEPSVAVASYLAQVRINGAGAVVDGNCRVVQYGSGAIVLPHAPAFQPLQVFSGPHFTGTAAALGQYVYYKGTGLGAMNANISSFKLKRGYMATLAQTENGSGLSRNYVAQDGDMEVSVLPNGFDNTVRFVYVLPWRWVDKKGSCDASPTDLQAGWWYNWNINQNSTRDLEYVAIRQQPYWPGLGQNWQTRGVNHLSGYNEPNNPVEDAYENLTPPGSVSDAVARWPELLATGLRVGAPAVTDGGQSWITDFMNQADAAGMRVDYVPVHYYRSYSNNDNPTGAATQLYNFLKGIYDAVKRPLWVTEFNNGANWTGDPDPTYAQNAAVIQAMIQRMDETPWVERYSVYSRVEFTRQTHYDEGGLTPMGVMYRDHVAPTAYLQGLQGNGTRSFTELRFDGEARDSSGHGNNGVTCGTPAYTNGYRGQALMFDGSNTKVTLPPNVANNNAFSFAAWVYWNGGGAWQRIFDFGNSTTHYMFLSPNAAGSNLRFAMRNGGGEQMVQGALLAPNSWQHVAVTLSGTTARLYLNGVQVAQNAGMSITPASFSPRVNFLGESQFIADPLFDGMLDEVLITDYALTAAQIAALQTNTPPQFTNTLFAGGAATEGVAYNNSMAGTATDADAGDTLSYSKAAGPAWLNVAANGTLTGAPTSADSGTNVFTVRVSDAAGQSAFALVTIAVTTTTASGTWIVDASDNWSASNRWSGNIVATGAGNTANFGAINILGNRTVTLDSSRSIGTLRFGDTSGSQTWTIAGAGGSALTLDSGGAASPALMVTNVATIAAPLAGTNGFTKSGPGTLILSGNNALSGLVNIDTGSTTISDGIVRVTGSGALANASQIRIRNNNSGSSTFQLDGSAGSISINADVSVTCRNNGVTTFHHLAGSSVFNGNILLFEGGNSHTVQSDAGVIVFTGVNRYIGGLMGARTYYFTGAGDHYLIGPLLNSTNGAPIALLKTNAGTLTLDGVNTYANGTTLAGGRLIVNGTLPAGTFNISSGTTLGGRGTIYPAITLPAGATIAPGASIGRLTVSNSVTLQAGSTTRIELNKAAGTNDQLRVVGALAYGGTLVVTNLDGQLWAGDAFQIFSSTIAPTGAFAVTNLPVLPSGFHWNWAPASGTLSITTTVALNPTNITASVAGEALVLSWPEDHTGWRVETNAVDIGEVNAWFTLPGTTETNQVFLPIDTSGKVFFRLRYP